MLGAADARPSPNPSPSSTSRGFVIAQRRDGSPSEIAENSDHPTPGPCASDPPGLGCPGRLFPCSGLLSPGFTPPQPARSALAAQARDGCSTAPPAPDDHTHRHPARRARSLSSATSVAEPERDPGRRHNVAALPTAPTAAAPPPPLRPSSPARPRPPGAGRADAGGRGTVSGPCSRPGGVAGRREREAALRHPVRREGGGDPGGSEQGEDRRGWTWGQRRNRG